jgi:hypothetical protein
MADSAMEAPNGEYGNYDLHLGCEDTRLPILSLHVSTQQAEHVFVIRRPTTSYSRISVTVLDCPSSETLYHQNVEQTARSISRRPFPKF